MKKSVEALRNPPINTLDKRYIHSYSRGDDSFIGGIEVWSSTKSPLYVPYTAYRPCDASVTKGLKSSVRGLWRSVGDRGLRRRTPTGLTTLKERRSFKTAFVFGRRVR